MIKNLKEIIIFILVVTAIGSAAWCFLLRRANVQERLLHEDMLFKENILKKKADEQLSRVQNEVDGLQKSIDNLISKSAQLESELIASRQELNLAKRNLTQLKNKNTSASRDIERINSNIYDLKNKIAHIVKETLDADEGLMLLLKTKDALIQQIEQYEQQAARKLSEKSRGGYLYKSDLDISQETLMDEAEFVSGEVLTVNREFSFLVINLGKSHGIEEGMTLRIKRDDKSLAQVRVETVRDHISAAALIDKENISQIRAGDKAFIVGGV
jgi:septal ring factor EnvC (AmiA/AmiB activator)